MLDLLKEQLDKKLPFVAFNFPSNNKIQVYYQQDKKLHTTTDFLTSGFVLAPFNKTTVFPFIPDVFQKTYSISNISITKSNTQIEDNKKASFINLVEKALNLLNTRKLKKVVVSRKLAVKSSNNPLQTFQNLIQLYPTAFVYFWYHPKVGLWMGATPERFVHLNQNFLETSALAATLPFEKKREPIWGNKEKEEQQLVTDTIQQCLKTSFPGITLTIDAVGSIQAGELWHLYTKITGNSSMFTIPKIIDSLHSTPAVGGIPKELSLNFIQNNEGYNRRYYTGFLGPFNLDKSGDLFVNLRCAEFISSKYYIYTGAGITSSSIPELEWIETQRKAKTFCEAL